MPATELPPPFATYLQLCSELVSHYPNGGVRKWLPGALPEFTQDVEDCLHALTGPQADTLMTVLCALGHTFRWDTVPPRQERFGESRIELPPALAHPWRLLAQQLDVPCVGSAWSMHLTNWRVKGRPTGASYTPTELSMQRVELMVQWLPPPYDEQLRHFSLIFVLSEAAGARSVAGCVHALDGAATGDDEAVRCGLMAITEGLDSARAVMSKYLRSPYVEPAHWLDMVQPTMPWGAITEDGEVSGPNGLQLATVQCVDAALGVGSKSLLGASSRDGRRFMPPNHRRFLAAVDQLGPTLRSRVRDCNDEAVKGAYNECLKALRAWRIVHMKRGASYLRASRGSHGRVSTGLGVAWRDGGHNRAIRTGSSGSDPVAFFEATMSDRIAETVHTMVETRDSGTGTATEDAAFALLDAEQRRKVMACGTERQFAAGQLLIARGARDQPLIIIEGGTAQVLLERGRPGPLVRPGEVIGEVSFMDDSGASASVVALSEVEATLLDREAIHETITKDPALAARLYQSLGATIARRLRRAEVREKRALTALEAHGPMSRTP
jgi:hypothetical protein